MTLRILLLEDNFDTADSMMRAFKLRGYDALHVGTVHDALLAYGPDEFDVMIVDYELPDGTGLNFLAKIRGSDKAVTILNSGLDRYREVEQSGLEIDHVLNKGNVGALWDILEGLS